VFLNETAAGLVVGLYPSPLAVLANDLAAPVLDLVDPYTGRADDDNVCVEASGHQETAYGDVLLGQLADEVGDESRLAHVPVASRRQSGSGASYRQGVSGDRGPPPAGEVRGIGKRGRGVEKSPNAVEGENRRYHEP
jgi:hypothetical protein